jgi:redox-sensitive bicupin YhaK (pirin superfamily)
VAEGSITIGDRVLAVGDLAVLATGLTAGLVAGADGAKLMLLGGAAMDGPRHIWWNFVSSTKERIEVAKVDWRDGRFAMVPGDPEFIPLPDK